MLVIRERVDGRQLGILGEILDVRLRKGADDRAMDHAAEHARGVLDVLPAAKLDFAGAEKHRLSAQFPDADLERNPRAGGGFGEKHGPNLARERLGLVMSALRLE